jgi:hypothetical protein
VVEARAFGMYRAARVLSTGSCTGILGSPLDDQSQEPRWYWPRVFLR